MKCSTCEYSDETDSVKYCPKCGRPLGQLHNSESLDKVSGRGSRDHSPTGSEQNNTGNGSMVPIKTEERKMNHISKKKVVLVGMYILIMCLLIYVITRYERKNEEQPTQIDPVRQDIIDNQNEYDVTDNIDTPVIVKSRIEPLPVLTVDQVYYAVYFHTSDRMLSNDDFSMIGSNYHIYYDQKDGSYRYYLGVWEMEYPDALTYAINHGYNKPVLVNIKNGKNIGEVSLSPKNNGEVQLKPLYNVDKNTTYYGVRISTQSTKNINDYNDIFKNNPSLNKYIYYQDKGAKESLRYILVIGAWFDKGTADDWSKKIKKVNERKYKGVEPVSYKNGKIIGI